RKPHSNINEERSGQNRPIWLSVAAKEVDALHRPVDAPQESQKLLRPVARHALTDRLGRG
ncbi:hypothetical protein, partial [Paracoccus halophilus]|uniref:hypothetical protein n=1 Tax=Paracoccus halophilus TaxID=376733 RepID=UPI001C3189D1